MLCKRPIEGLFLSGMCSAATTVSTSADPHIPIVLMKSITALSALEISIYHCSNGLFVDYRKGFGACQQCGGFGPRELNLLAVSPIEYISLTLFILQLSKEKKQR